MNLKGNQNSNYFILVGDEKNWNLALLNKTWGFTDKKQGTWKRTSEGEKIMFYVTNPIKKIIGYGTVKKKFIGDGILFHDEVILGKVIWKYRFSFEIDHLVTKWYEGVSPPKNLILNTGKKSIPKLIFQDIKKLLIKK